MSKSIDSIKPEEQSKQERVARRLVHEIMNPIGSMSLAVESLTLELPENETVRILGKSIDRLTRLVKSYAFAIRKPSIKPNQISLKETVENVLDELDGIIELRKIKVNKDGLTDNVVINADADRLSEAIMHIIINAVEASEFEKREIRLSTESDKNFVQFKIRDFGKGIPEESMELVFDPLFTTKTGHLGLGLTSAENIILAHQGSIHIRNHPEKGVEATIHLPKQGV